MSNESPILLITSAAGHAHEIKESLRLGITKILNRFQSIRQPLVNTNRVSMNPSVCNLASWERYRDNVAERETAKPENGLTVLHRVWPNDQLTHSRRRKMSAANQTAHFPVT